MNSSAPGARTELFRRLHKLCDRLRNVAALEQAGDEAPGAARDVPRPCPGGRSNIAGTARPGWRSQERGRGEKDDRRSRGRGARTIVDPGKAEPADILEP